MAACRSPVKRITDQVLADFGIPRVGPHLHQLPDPLRLARRRQAALEGTGITVPPLEALRRQALGLLGAPPRPRPVQGPHAASARSRQAG